jgi:hypothetical protein
MRTLFLYPGYQIKRLGRSRLRVVLNRRMALRTQNLPSGRLKRRFWRSMKWSFKVSIVMENHFQHYENRKKWLFRCRLSDVISSRMVLRNYNLTSERIKKRLWWSRWSDVWRCPNAMRNLFLHPGHWKKRFERRRLSGFTLDNGP